MSHSKISFKNDYSESAHPLVLEALQRDFLKQEAGYGEDSSTLRACDLIRSLCQKPNAEVHFVTGGTLANLVVTAALLQPYESIIAPASGHICVHESGAIEATGHKIHEIAHKNGKICPSEIEEVVNLHTDEHMVRPRMVYISQTTELGTVYSRSEIESITQTCAKHNLLFYLDGARLGSALASSQDRPSLPELASLVDAFYIGGTKNGALFGEAIVLCRPNLAPHFRNHLKQRGALLAKGRALGAQFEALFTDNLFLELAKKANSAAEKFTAGIGAKGYQFAYPPMSNQIFPILPDESIKKLSDSFDFYIWNRVDSGHRTIRLVTSWATSEESIERFIEVLSA